MDPTVRRTHINGIYLEGGNDDSVPTFAKELNQYLLFENIYIERVNSQANCLKLTGSILNTTFINSQFSMPYSIEEGPTDVGTNIYIESRSPEPPENNCQISFIDCTSGGSGIGVAIGCKIVKSENINFSNCWFENTDFALWIENSEAINLIGNRFVNASGCGGRPYSSVNHYGACVRAENSFITIENSYVTVSQLEDQIDNIRKELFFAGIGNNIINVRNNYFNHILLSETFGITQTEDITTVTAYNYSPFLYKKGIDCGSKKTVLVKTSTNFTVIERINSTINAGESLFIRAENGDITINAWNPIQELSGRNIYLGGPTQFVLKHGKAATFMKLDGVNEREKCCYQLTSVY